MNDLDFLLKHIKKSGININEIYNKFPKLKYKFEYVKPEHVQKGDIIRYVDLNYNKLSMSGVVVKITYKNTYFKEFKSFLLFNRIKNVFWKIKPKKYYLFVSLNNGNVEMRNVAEKLLEENYKTYLNNIKN